MSTTAAQADPPHKGDLFASSAMTLPAPLTAVGATGHKITYWSNSLGAGDGAAGADIKVTGMVLLPPGTAPSGGWPVVSWGHGTTGTADVCAPSSLPNLGGYDTYLPSLIQAGYAVTATDYEGLGTDGPHPYLIAKSEARGMIDAVRAARQLHPSLSDKWFAVGHSQGSQAGGRAAEIVDTYGEGLDFQGTVAMGAPINLEASIDQRLAAIAGTPQGGDGDGDYGSQAYYLMILSGLKTRHPDLDFDDYLGAGAQQKLPELETGCLIDLYLSFMDSDLPASEFQPAGTHARNRLHSWINKEAVPNTRESEPMTGPFVIFYGDADEIVTPPEAQASIDLACANGTHPAWLKTYPGVNHDGTVVAAKEDVITWLNAVLAGQTPDIGTPPACP
ncbi:lipase family protein [Actinokineospora alba]|uniref:lipase family protein n=1 Tax=Actinokineospora alba TaxID=504798 RepID=UPI001415292F|nr:lipase family protein [Actinokineospora alba]